MTIHRVIRFAAAIGGAGAATFLFLEVTRAQSTPSSEVLVACFVPSSGTVYRVQVSNAPNDCVDPAHVKFTWNSQGPAGPAGAPGTNGTNGAAGAPGTNGTNGTNGVSGWEKIVVTGAIENSGGGSVDAPCPSGKKVVGGGFFSPRAGNESNIMFSRPNDAGNAWQSGWNQEPGDSTGLADFRSLTVFAICVSTN